MPHKFRLHQRVRIESEAAIQQASPDGLYDIVQLMPQSQNGQYDYRLKSSSGERVASEGSLIPHDDAVSEKKIA